MGNIVFKAIKLGTHITGVSAGIQSSEAKAAPVSRGGGKSRLLWHLAKSLFITVLLPLFYYNCCIFILKTKQKPHLRCYYEFTFTDPK